MVTTKLNLSMTEPQVRQIYAKQGDTGRVLDITLDQTPEDGTLRILRPDGVEVTSEAVTGGEVESGGSFESLTEADVTELTVGIEPVQDLNGYDKPWVGGAGKNILDVADRTISDWEQTPETIRAEGCTVTKSGDTLTCTITGAWSKLRLAIDTSTLVNGQSYTVSAKFSNPSANVVGVAWYDTTWHNTTTSRDTTATVSTSFTYSSDMSTVALGFIVNNTNASTGNTVVVSEMQLEKGSSKTSFAPYSNICPITGHDEVTVYDDPVYGKTIKWNQLIKNGNFADASNWGTWGGTITVSGNVATVTTPGQWNQLSQAFDWTYGHIMLARASVKKFGESGSVSVKVVNDFAYSNQQFAKGIATNDVWTDVVFCGTYTKTPSDSTAQVRFGVQEYRPSNSNNGFQIKNVGVFDLTEMFGEGNEPTIEEFEALFPKDYYPYNTGEETTVSAVNGDPNRQYTTSLGQTVYGGTLDMVTGVLTVTHAIVDLSSLSWMYDGSVPRFYSYGIQNTVKAPSLNSEIADIICTQYISTSLEGGVSLYGGLNGSVAVSAGKVVSVRDEAYTSASTFKDAMEGVMLCYALATPVEYQLTPQQIKTLVGTNNVWASSGDIVSIKFTYGGLFAELPSDATSVVGKCYCDIEQNGVSSMPFTLNVKKNERQ